MIRAVRTKARYYIYQRLFEQNLLEQNLLEQNLLEKYMFVLLHEQRALSSQQLEEGPAFEKVTLGFKTSICLDTGKSRVARFFLIQHTKTGKNIPNNHKLNQKATN
jgi:hypothetical protein